MPIAYHTSWRGRREGRTHTRYNTRRSDAKRSDTIRYDMFAFVIILTVNPKANPRNYKLVYIYVVQFQFTHRKISVQFIWYCFFFFFDRFWAMVNRCSHLEYPLKTVAAWASIVCFLALDAILSGWLSFFSTFAFYLFLVAPGGGSFFWFLIVIVVVVLLLLLQL